MAFQEQKNAIRNSLACKLGPAKRVNPSNGRIAFSRPEIIHVLVPLFGEIFAFIGCCFGVRELSSEQRVSFEYRWRRSSLGPYVVAVSESMWSRDALCLCPCPNVMWFMQFLKGQCKTMRSSVAGVIEGARKWNKNEKKRKRKQVPFWWAYIICAQRIALSCLSFGILVINFVFVLFYSILASCYCHWWLVVISEQRCRRILWENDRLLFGSLSIFQRIFFSINFHRNLLKATTTDCIAGFRSVDSEWNFDNFLRTMRES